jgi:hypothetical protein
MTVPTGTVQDVLDWVGDDPERAQEALVAERDGQNRSTLVSQLESISCGGDDDETGTGPMTASTTDASTSGETPETAGGINETPDDDEDGELWPPVPDLVIDANDQGVHFTTIHLRDSEVEVPEGADLRPDPDGDDEQPIEADEVEFFQLAGNTRGIILAINGTGFAFGQNMVAALKGALEQGIAGMSL